MGEVLSMIPGKLTEDLQIVVIDNFYHSLDQKEAMDWIGKLFRFKVNSYLASFPFGVLPFGGADLIGIHWVLCKREGESLIPIMGLKTIDSKTTDAFRMTFPGLSIVNQPELKSHQIAIQHELNKAAQNGYGLGYLGSWTVDPGVRKSLALTKFCRKACSAFCALWIEHYNIQAAITFANARFNVEKFHAYLGLKRMVGVNGENLSNFNNYEYFDEELSPSVFYRANHSEASKQDAIDLQDLWDRRIFFGSPDSPIAIGDPRKKEAA